MKPTYKHDCDRCVLWYTDEYDWYVCDSPCGRSIISRYGNDGPDYISVPIAACVDITTLELAALARGFAFTQEERSKLWSRMLDQKLDKLDFPTWKIVAGHGIAWRKDEK